MLEGVGVRRLRLLVRLRRALPQRAVLDLAPALPAQSDLLPDLAQRRLRAQPSAPLEQLGVFGELLVTDPGRRIDKILGTLRGVSGLSHSTRRRGG